MGSLASHTTARTAAIFAVFALASTGLVGASGDSGASSLATDTLPGIAPQTPQDHGSAEVDGLQYADPTEGLEIIDPPDPNAGGTAGTSYDLDLPPGHGFTPELTVTYDSGAENSWMGQGWDLNSSAITVDTTFGAPHFSGTHESESYLHDGQLLVPNAHDDAWEARDGSTRRDFTHQIETEYAEIIRHVVNDGGPDDYFWEVRGKDGGVRWYGGTPDSGGPVPSTAPADQPTLDEAAVIRDVNGNIVTWLLSAERDIGVNLVRYEYETVKYTFGSNAWIELGANDTCNASNAVCGRHTFLDRIIYTDATSAITDFNGAPYAVDLIRESETGGFTGRPDPIVDASLGFVDVLVDRLARVEVRWGADNGTRTRTWPTANDDNVAGRWDFDYTTGWFGKSLLSTVTQGVDDLHVHTLEYFNDLGADPGTDVEGFSADPDRTSIDEVGGERYFDDIGEVGLLGGSETNAGYGNVYVGFNPGPPSKTGSFGGALELNGGDTDALAEWVDLNGDSLPDKVFLDGDEVKFRLNQGATGANAFTTGTPHGSALDTLSASSNFGFQISFEAYPLVAVGVGTGMTFSWSSTYFSDVNADGLIDFVSGGTVWFNTLDNNGIPTFSTSSATTPVPLEPATLPPAGGDRLAEIEEQFRTQSPPIDTVRRFVVPHSGNVSIDAPVALDALGLTTVDGVRVAIQHNGSEVASATLTSGTPSAFASPIARAVTAGDTLWFRVGSVDDGVADSVSWTPTITYQVPAGNEALWPDDANGLSQTTYSSEQDFTLAGRPGDNQPVPYTGTVQVTAALTLDEALTDDVELVILRDDPVWDSGDDVIKSSFTAISVSNAVVTADSPPGTTNWTVNVPVTARALQTDVDADGDGSDDLIDVTSALQVYIAADSPVDVNEVDWNATMVYTAAEDADGNAIPVVDDAGEPIFEHHVRPHVEFYPGAHPSAPAVMTSLPATFLASVTVHSPSAGLFDTTTAHATFKNGSGVVSHEITLVNNLPVEFNVDLSSLGGAGDYWVDVSVRDAAFSMDGLVLGELKRWTDKPNNQSQPINGRLRWAGTQGAFPMSWRGWALAGYTAADALATSAIDRSAFNAENLADQTDDQPDRGDLSLDESDAPPSYPFVAVVAGDGGTTAQAVDTATWMGPREPINGTATSQRSSRLAADSADLSSRVPTGGGAGGRSAPSRLGISGPALSLMAGIGPVSGSFGMGPSWGITDFADLNGDGYPDQLSEDDVTYTDQLGGYLPEREGPFDVANQDLTFSLNGGLTSGLVDIPANPKGGTNAVQGTSAATGASASDAGPSFGLGVSGSGGFSWTSPNASGGDGGVDSTYDDQFSELEADSNLDGTAIQRAYADVNGDGLADRVYTTADGVFARYNLGYSFTEAAVDLGTGGFETRESATGGAGLGFSLPWGEFSGGVNLLWNYDWSDYSWRDLNGDGILDQLQRVGETEVEVRFGTGSGLLAPINYGDLPDVTLTDAITSPQHIAFDQTTGVGGGGSGTAYIGPLCLPLPICYVIVNVGAGYNNSVSATTVDLTDVDGDGYADAVRSNDDDRLEVWRNIQDRTNLLQEVVNPLGGSFTLDYTRMGNTTDHPGSLWALTSVTMDDGHDLDGPGGDDGTDVYGQTISYAGLRHDRAHRSSLGFNRVTVTETDAAGNAQRITRHDYLNDNVFVAGLLVATTLFEPGSGGGAPVPLKGSAIEWGLRDVQDVATDFDPREPVDLVAPGDLTETSTVASRGRSIAPLVTSTHDFGYDDTGARTFEQVIDMTWDGLGNVLVEYDHGADDRTSDDVVTSLTYSDCTNSTTNGCLPDASATSPLAGAGTCVNWASYPGRVRVQVPDDGGVLETVRERSGLDALCDNGAVTEQRMLVEGGATPTWAVTNMTVNAYGDYELVMAPPGDDGTRYLVRYTYDDDRHTDIAMVEEFDVAEANVADVLANGPTPATATAGISSSATFDPLSGRVASRTDANGATRTWTYDFMGRVATISKMSSTTTTPDTLVTFEYHANDPDHPWARASHDDEFDGNAAPTGTNADGDDTTETLDTITFVDGLSRVTQTKRDARMLPPGATDPHSGRQVTGTMAFDELGRPVVDFAAVADDGPAGTFSTAAFAGNQTTTTWTTTDRALSTTQPGDRTTTFAYSLARPEPSDPLLWTVAVTDPDGGVATTGSDIRGHQLFHEQSPAPRVDDQGDPIPQDPSLTTRWVISPIGEIQSMVDQMGATSTYEHDRAGRTTAVTTPNQGLTTTTWDLAGRRVSRTNETMRAAGTSTTYDYALNRIVEVDNPGIVDDITYTYGTDNVDGRHTAGRIAQIDDRSRIMTPSYDSTGSVVAETVEAKRKNWSDDLNEAQREKFRTRMAYEWGQLGRLATVTYPDAKTVQVVPAGTSVANLTDPSQLDALLVDLDQPGEIVTWHYDSGGLVDGVTGVEDGVELVPEPINHFDDQGVQTVLDVPRETVHDYDYVLERIYDHRLLPVHEEMGNDTITSRTFDPDTRWLTEQETTALSDPDDATSDRVARQDMSWTYDDVGRPLTYANALPPGNRAINGGGITQDWTYDGFGRVVAATGTFSLDDDLDGPITQGADLQTYNTDLTFDPATPWNAVTKNQHDQVQAFKPNGRPGRTTIVDESTYSFQRTLGTADGPLHLVQDVHTDSDDDDTTYAATLNDNGAILSMLNPDDNQPGPAEPNVWDRQFTFNHLNQMTSAEDGSELRTFSYTDVGALFIQDGSLLADDGTVLHQSGGGPETVFLNRWVTIRSQKIYKHVWIGDDPIMVQMDSGAGVESKQLYAHRDFVGSTNMVTDDKGRGFQRHEYFPSGEIWIDDRKEEIRTPFQFAEGYYEDEFDIILFGQRWYDAERELFLSPDPLLLDDPGATFAQPVLTAAYTYAAGSPTSAVDPSGRQVFQATQKREIVAAAQAEFEEYLASPRVSKTQAVALRAQVDQALAATEAASRADPNPLFEYNWKTKTLKVGFWYGKRYKKQFGVGSSSNATGLVGSDDSFASVLDDSEDSLDATSVQGGGPDAGGEPEGRSRSNSTDSLMEEFEDEFGIFGDLEGDVSSLREEFDDEFGIFADFADEEGVVMFDDLMRAEGIAGEQQLPNSARVDE